MRALYLALVSAFIRWAVRFTRARGRVVHYTHGGRLYMTRYAIWGHLTGDGQAGLRAWLPNLYIHQMHAPDLDPSLHDHPWPWAVSLIMLGGYREERRVIIRNEPSELPLNHPDNHYKPSMPRVYCQEPSFWRVAPALNFLKGGTFHRVAELEPEICCTEQAPCGDWLKRSCLGTWTLFLAGPRRSKKAWGYLVAGRGYVPHQERHNEIEGQEVREPEPFKPATGKYLEALGFVIGLERRKRCRFLGLLNESDKDFRGRIYEDLIWLRGGR